MGSRPHHWTSTSALSTFKSWSTCASVLIKVCAMKLDRVTHLLVLAIGLSTSGSEASLKTEFSCNSDGTSGNSSYPACATDITNFEAGMYQRERPWISGNETELLPPWTDIPLAIKGQQFAIDRVAGIVQSHLYGITLILANPQLRDALLFTGNSNTVQKSGKRYAATVVQIGLWIRRALEQPPSDANWVLTSIAQVRRIHNHVALRIQKDLDHGDFPAKVKATYASAPINAQLWSDFEKDLEESGLRSNYPLKLGNISVSGDSGLHPMNQLTFATTQWAFLGLILMNPEAVNVFYPTEEGLGGFAHLWAIIGYAMGIRDEFNLGLGNGSENLKKLNAEFFSHHITPHLFNLSHESKFLMEVFIKVKVANSSSRVVVGLDPEFLLRGILRDVLGIRNPRHMNGRRGFYGVFVDLVSGHVGPRILHKIFPPVDKILSPLASLYHFFVGFAHFGWNYRSDQDIARFCYFYDYEV